MKPRNDIPDNDDALDLFREQLEIKSDGCDDGCDHRVMDSPVQYRGAPPERGHTGTISRKKSEMKEDILDGLKAEMNEGPRRAIPVEEDIFYGPGVAAPYSGVYALVDESGDATGAQQTIAKGSPFPPTDRPGLSYTLTRDSGRQSRRR